MDQSTDLPLAKVLLVDDHPANLLALQAMLEGPEVSLVTASSGQEVWTCLQRDDYAVILLDVCLPGMNGFEIARMIRQRPKSQNTPIIFVTAIEKGETQVLKGYDLGAVDYLVKPLAPEIVRAKVGIFVELFRKTEELHREIAQRLRAEEALALRSEAALARRAEELARSNAELEQFAYVASHDLQEPLRMVSSYMELLAKRYQGRLDEKADTYIAFARDGALRMQKLIRDLLAYSRVGRKENTLVRTDCNSVVSQAIANLQAAIRDRGAIVKVDEMPTVMADAAHLTQVFQNLLSNAVKFCEAQPPEVHVSAESQDVEWVFAVRDNGIGIAPEHAERVFAIFQRLHTQSKYPGTGIGLAICKKVIEQHGGRMWLESQPGRGSVFYFAIPKRKEQL